MAEVDSLEVKITADAQSAEQSLNRLISKLDKVSSTLGTVTRVVDGSAYRKSTQQINQAATEMANNLIKEYGISDRETKAKIKSLTKTLAEGSKQLRLTGKGDNSNALDQLGQILVANTKKAQGFDDSLNDALQTLRKTKLYVSDVAKANIGKNWDNMRKALPQTFTTNPDNTSVDSIYKNTLYAQYPHLFGDSNGQPILNEADQFAKIVEVVRQAQDQLRNHTVSTNAEIEQATTQAAESISRNYNTMATAIQSALKPDGGAMENIGASIKNSPLFNSDTINQAVANVESLSKAFSGIGEITVNATGLSEFANAVGILGKSDMSGAVENINSLNTALNGVNTGTSVMQLATGLTQLSGAMNTIPKTSRFTALAKNIEKLATVNSQGLTETANSLGQMTNTLAQLSGVADSIDKLSQLAKGIAKLGNKSVTTAITNMPLLAKEMENLMQSLARAPTVSKNLIDMTNALANLSNQGQRVGSATRSLNQALNNTNKTASKSKGHFKGLASTIGLLYAKFFLVLRALSWFKSAIKSSMDYIENYNYLTAAFEQVSGSVDLKQFKEAGYKSAEEYYRSFQDRTTELTRKMTGYQLNDNGTLSATNQASLGMNPSFLISYQAQFAQISSSMGETADTATKLSSVMTRLGADLASVKNMEFSDVYDNLTSALVGMSRSVDKYGINIRNVNLQQRLTDLGIQANITNLGQQEKALLRTIIMLDTSRYAWSDMSDTLKGFGAVA